jgi:hypothetical protein
MDGVQMETNDKVKKPLALNIISNKVDHKGFGAGSIDLNSVSGMIIDGDQAYIDEGTLHAKSKVEKGIKFSMNKEDVPNGRKCWIVWVAVGRKEEGPYYAGVASCEMLIDTEARRGWKILAEHVNRMDRAMKRKILLENLDAAEKAVLKEALIGHNPEWWEHSEDELKLALQ